MNTNYSDAVQFADKRGITQEVFLEYADKKLGIDKNQAKEIFNSIDYNGSGGLREREFNKFGSNSGSIDGNDCSGSCGSSEHGDSGISTRAIDTGAGGSAGGSAGAGAGGGADVGGGRGGAGAGAGVGGGGGGGSSVDNISGVRIGTTDKLIRDGSRNVNDEFKTSGANYLLLAESHGREHNKLGLSDAPKIEGYQVVGGGGSGDKSAFMYKRVSNVDVATIEGNIGSGTVTRIYSDKNLGFRAETTDPGYNSGKLEKPGSREIGFYFEDEGGKGNRNASFNAAGFKTIFGGDGDDQVDIMPDSWSNVPNGNGAQGFIYEK